MKLSRREVIHAMTCSVAEWHQMSNEKRTALIDLEIAKCKEFCNCEKPYITHRAVPPMCLHCGKEEG